MTNKHIKQDNSKNFAAIVTGGSRGIGASITKSLVENGIPVYNLDISPPLDFSPAAHIQVDISNASQLQKVLKQVCESNNILYLINNAGVGGPLNLEDVSLDAFQRLTDINVRAAILCAQAVLPAMKAASFGRIINITSRSALGKEGRTIYSGTKAALIGMTRTWALELGRYGITVNAVGPGPIGTELFWRSNPKDSPKTQSIINEIPIKRIGEPEDVAAAVEYFISDKAGFVTGQTLFVCGGLTIGSTH
ncbi:SDR family oxidoreductase [Advenella sp. WQ 585]|uniref:SDR family oxidoreductase n=1 Tax=Advenella mandrilli TaxID=2800330 RepID=A0ABS1EHG7_9BURK|nr:SDR family oxidoreductase [Advenella mandrilli]MBK1782473.1 SDR family oxidoreductase [Advenella mandrilli]